MLIRMTRQPEPTVTCASCSQSWAVVPSILKAHPGYRSEPVSTVTVPLDIYGNPSGKTSPRMSSRWISQGESAQMTQVQSPDALTVYAWTCTCGQSLTYEAPALEIITCSYAAGPSGLCYVADRRTNPPEDLHVNPGHGGSCVCCGLNGQHTVRVDRQGYRPLCLH